MYVSPWELKREPAGSQKHSEPAALTAGMSFSQGHDRAFMSAVTHRQLLHGDRPLLMLDGLHILFSQVNRDLRDMFPGSRELSPSYRTAFHGRGERYRTRVQLKNASVASKRSPTTSVPRIGNLIRGKSGVSRLTGALSAG
jgi:hypothetical protein